MERKRMRRLSRMLRRQMSKNGSLRMMTQEEEIEEEEQDGEDDEDEDAQYGEAKG